MEQQNVLLTAPKSKTQTKPMQRYAPPKAAFVSIKLVERAQPNKKQICCYGGGFALVAF